MGDEKMIVRKIISVALLYGASAMCLVEAHAQVFDGLYKYKFGTCSILISEIEKENYQEFGYVVPNTAAISMNPSDVKFYDPNNILDYNGVQQVAISKNSEPAIVLDSIHNKTSYIILILNRKNSLNFNKSTPLYKKTSLQNNEETVLIVDNKGNKTIFGNCVFEYSNNLESINKKLSNLPKTAAIK
jgi:hypothetical protein